MTGDGIEFEYALIRKIEELRGETGYNGVPSNLLSDVVFCQSSGLSRCERWRGEVTTLNLNMWFIFPEHLSSGLICSPFDDSSMNS